MIVGVAGPNESDRAWSLLQNSQASIGPLRVTAAYLSRACALVVFEIDESLVGPAALRDPLAAILRTVADALTASGAGAPLIGLLHAGDGGDPKQLVDAVDELRRDIDWHRGDFVVDAVGDGKSAEDIARRWLEPFATEQHDSIALRGVRSVQEHAASLQALDFSRETVEAQKLRNLLAEAMARTTVAASLISWADAVLEEALHEHERVAAEERARVEEDRDDDQG